MLSVLRGLKPSSTCDSVLGLLLNKYDHKRATKDYSLFIKNTHCYLINLEVCYCVFYYPTFFFSWLSMTTAFFCDLLCQVLLKYYLI